VRCSIAVNLLTWSCQHCLCGGLPRTGGAKRCCMVFLNGSLCFVLNVLAILTPCCHETRCIQEEANMLCKSSHICQGEMEDRVQRDRPFLYKCLAVRLTLYYSRNKPCLVLHFPAGSEGACMPNSVCGAQDPRKDLPGPADTLFHSILWLKTVSIF
jgi:hypothetical protein